MSEKRSGEREGKRGRPYFVGVGFLSLGIVFAVWKFPESPFWLGLVVALLAVLAMAFTYRYREHEGQVKDWLRLIYSWLVGLSVSGAGILLWDCLVNESLHQELYVQGLAAISLAGLTAGFTYWRGQQTKEQIEKAQKQIKEAQRQARFQSFDSIVQMAVDNSNLGRQVAGWERLRLWCDNAPKDPKEEDLEDWITFLGVIHRVSEKVSAASNVLIAAHARTPVHKSTKREVESVGKSAKSAFDELQKLRGK